MQMVTMTSYHDIVILYNSVKALAQGHNLLYLGKIGIYTTHKVQDMDETCAQMSAIQSVRFILILTRNAGKIQRPVYVNLYSDWIDLCVGCMQTLYQLSHSFTTNELNFECYLQMYKPLSQSDFLQLLHPSSIPLLWFHQLAP